MTRFRKKPVEIDAIRWRGPILNTAYLTLFDDWIVANQGDLKCRYVGEKVVIPTLEGEMTASPGDWIIKGIKGELYPCKPDIFAELYELAP